MAPVCPHQRLWKQTCELTGAAIYQFMMIDLILVTVQCFCGQRMGVWLWTRRRLRYYVGYREVDLYQPVEDSRYITFM